MMTYEENLELIRQQGRSAALSLRENAKSMTGTDIIAQERNAPPFAPDKDYSGWPANAPVTDEGQVWLLLIPHNAVDYPGLRPSGNRACWGLAHTTDPAKAKPWMPSYGTSGLYLLGECCTYPHTDGTDHVWRNLYDGNDFPPLTQNVEDRWEDLGEVSAWM